jgi:hypothetical protein
LNLERNRVPLAKALIGCHENSMTRRDRYASVHALGSEHTTIFIHNGAPQALVGCLGPEANTGALSA